MVSLRFRVEESAIIDAPASVAYTAIADYNQHHGNIIPPQFFGGMRVLKGSGVGTGTRIACTFCVMGTTDTLIMDVTELQPQLREEQEEGGSSTTKTIRILQEIDNQAKNITQFRVLEKTENTCLVTIRTDTMRQQGWFAGAVDEWFVTRIMRHMYREELKQLNKYVQTMIQKTGEGS